MSKKSFNFVAVILATVTVIGLSSCKDKVYYSCDPTIDAVIRQNLPKYEGMTREEWKKLPDSLKRPAFRAMTTELKKEFWMGKQKEILSSKIFNDAEKKHISKLYDYLLSIDGIYTDKYKDGSLEMQKLFEYYKEWAIYGLDNFKWSVVDIFLIAEDGEELTEDYIEHVKQNSKPATELEQAGGSDCNCSWDLGCMDSNSTCEKIPCRDTDWGCKFLFMGSCTKKCKGPFTMNGQVVDAATYSNQKELLEYMLK